MLWGLSHHLLVVLSVLSGPMCVFFCYECMAIVINLVVITLIGKVLFK